MKKVNIWMENRGYSCECIVDSPEFNKNEITILGNYSKSNFNQTSIVSKYGIIPTFTENHGQVTAILEEV